jgi:hypothetical protein
LAGPNKETIVDIQKRQLDPNKEIIQITHKVTAPKVWWPNGHGQQNLIPLIVEITGEGEKVGETKNIKNKIKNKSAWEGRVGLRHLVLDTASDVSFFFYYYYSFLFYYYLLLFIIIYYYLLLLIRERKLERNSRS